jgi:hypothetical protein
VGTASQQPIDDADFVSQKAAKSNAKYSRGECTTPHRIPINSSCAFFGPQDGNFPDLILGGNDDADALRERVSDGSSRFLSINNAATLALWMVCQRQNSAPCFSRSAISTNRISDLCCESTLSPEAEKQALGRCAFATEASPHNEFAAQAPRLRVAVISYCVKSIRHSS